MKDCSYCYNDFLSRKSMTTFNSPRYKIPPLSIQEPPQIGQCWGARELPLVISGPALAPGCSSQRERLTSLPQKVCGF
jgi:hypothetical protein